MRDGLRSSVKLLAKTEESETSPYQATVKMDVEGTEEKGFSSTDVSSPKFIGSLTEVQILVSPSKVETEMNQIDGPMHAECAAGRDTGENIVVECTDNRRKRNRVDDKGDSEDDSVKKQKVDDDAMDGKLQVVGRVLRSGSTVKSDGEKKPAAEQSNDGFVGKEARKVVFAVNSFEVEKEKSVRFDGSDSYQSGNMMSRKLLRKRGRPPKTLKSELQQKWGDVVKESIEQSAGQESVKKLKRKRGRPPKTRETCESEKKWGDMEKEGVGLSSQSSCQTKNEENEQLKPRSGRPPKAQGSDLYGKRSAEVEEGDESHGVVRKKLELCGRPSSKKKGKKVHALRKNKLVKHNVHMNHNVGNSSSLLSEKGLGEDYSMALLPDKKLNYSNDDKERGNTKKVSGEMGHRRLWRQTVRDKILELLLGAGWEIQYRPRNGREYKDAVYVNPEGRTHWSITLAYRMLKKHYEDGEGNSNTCMSGFKFTPIPDEELSILTKVMVKERSDKNKKKKKRKWDREKFEKTTDFVTSSTKGNLHERKLGAVAGVKFMKSKGRRKMKFRDHRQHKSAFRPGQGAAKSLGDHKLLETHGRKRCALMVRNSQEDTKSEGDGYVLYNGKRTVLAWMIALGTVQLDEKVHYLKRRKTRAVLRGRIRTDGIQCDCCNRILTIENFEAHAGGKSCQPLKNIYLETGSSLFQCQVDSWNKQDESSRKGFHFVDIGGEDPNDDTCGICGDGGDLICCDGCPSTFHQSCLGIKKFPSGLWHCIFCLCKFCGMASGNTHQIDDNNASPLLALITCCFCEEKYHQSCAQLKDTISDDPDGLAFCGKKCQELYKRLHMLFGLKHELDEGFSWTLLRRFDVGPDVSLSGMPLKVECNSKLAVALHVMDECFLPMADHRSGVNLIRNIVYNFGSNFNRLNYSGFFTAILERGDEIIAAASIRIHGNHLAEMPFIGTRYMYRRQGMCRRLLNAIEMALCSLNVEKLVIPAVSELRETWTSVFGFKPLEGMSKKILKNMNMLVFPGVDMLQKPLVKHQLPGENLNLIQGLEPTELGELHNMEDIKDTFVGRSLAGFDLKDYNETGIPHSCNMINELAAVEPVSLRTDACMNDASEVAIKSANSAECQELCVISDNLDGRIETIVKPHDSSNDTDKQYGNEILKNSDERYRAGLDLEVYCETSLRHACDLIGESAVIEPVSLLPGGCLNDTSDVIIQSANTTKCKDSGLACDNIDRINESIVKPHDFSHDIDKQSENEKMSNSNGRCPTEFDLEGSSYARKIIGEPGSAEHDSLFLDGCLNDISDISIQGVKNTKCQVQPRVILDILGGENENIMEPVDSLCNVRKQSDDEMINNCDGSDSAGFDLKSSGEADVACAYVIGEPAAAESLRLPDGCLIEASDPTIQDRNKIKCCDQSGIVSSLTTDNALQGLHAQLNHHNLSGVGSKLSVVSHRSEAANHLGDFTHASTGGSETVSSEVKIEGINVEHKHDSIGEDSMHTTSQILSSQSQDLASDHGLNVADENASLNSCDVVKSTSSKAHQRSEDALNVLFAALPAEQNFSSVCQKKGPDGQETEILARGNSNVDDLCNVTASDTSMKPNLGGHMNDALCLSIEASTSYGDGVNELKDTAIKNQSDVLSLDGVLMSDRTRVDTKLLKPPGSDSEIDCASVTQSNSESMCGSSSASGVALLCASGGVNSCGAPEVIMLSNQAN